MTSKVPPDQHPMPGNGERSRAYLAVRDAIQIGVLPPLDGVSCRECGQPARHYHHANGYSEAHQLDVTPLCGTCHHRAHGTPQPAGPPLASPVDLPLSPMILGQGSFDFWRKKRRETWGDLAYRCGLSIIGLYKVRHGRSGTRGPNRATIDGIVRGFRLMHACQIKELAPYVAIPANVTIVDLETIDPEQTAEMARRLLSSLDLLARSGSPLALDDRGRLTVLGMEVQPAPAVGVADPPASDRGDGDPGDPAP